MVDGGKTETPVWHTGKDCSDCERPHGQKGAHWWKKIDLFVYLLY